MSPMQDLPRSLPQTPVDVYSRMNQLAERGRRQRADGDLAAASSSLADALRWARLLPAADAAVELLCELAEMASEAGERQLHETRGYAFEAARLAAHCADPLWEVHALLRVSDALALCGDHTKAITLQCRALALIVAPELAPLQAGSGFGEFDATPRVEAQ